MSTKENLVIKTGTPAIVENSGIVTFEKVPLWVNELKSLDWRPESVMLCDPLSYCAGVVRANIAVEQMLDEKKDFRDTNGVSVYLYHAPIHNDSKLKEWEERGAYVVGGLQEVPDESSVLFSAHGVSPQVWLEARRKRLKGKDATCPLVDKTHREAKELASNGYRIFLVGHEKHDEILGTVGEAPDNITVINPKINFDDLGKIIELYQDSPLALRTQTTLAVEDTLDLINFCLTKRPDLNLPNHSDICYATQNRQEAVLQTIKNAGADTLVIFGSDENKRQPSSNSIRLREVAADAGSDAYLVEDVREIKANYLLKSNKLALSAGASADPKRVAEMLVLLYDIGVKRSQVKHLTVAEEPQVFSPAKDFDFSKAV